jgi:hypothetical protein
MEGIVYRIERKDGRILVYGLNDRVVFSSPDSSYVITRDGEGKMPQAVMLKDRSDPQVLVLLATAIKLPMDKE